MAGAGWGPAITLWNDAGTPLANFHASASWQNAIAFAPDERHLAAGSSDGVARIWRVEDGGRRATLLHELKEHGFTVVAVAWSPSAQCLAVGVSDGSVHLWRLLGPRPERFAVLRGHGDKPVHALLFLDERRLLSGGADGAIQTWTTSIAELTAQARRRVDRTSVRAAGASGDDDADALAIDRFAAAGDAVQLDALARRILDSGSSDRRRLGLSLRAATRAVDLSGQRHAGHLATLARVFHASGAAVWAAEYQARAVRAAESDPRTGDPAALRRDLLHYRELAK